MTHETRQNRMVTTFVVGDWPAGVLTGCEREGNVYWLEHVIVFPTAPRGFLLRMLQAGIEEAWSLHFGAIVFCIPDAFPLARRLESVGRRFGFVPYTQEGGYTWYVKHKT
jgi:hypothetical protein